MDEKYINDKGEEKDVTVMNSFELVNGLVKYARLSTTPVDTIRNETNIKLLKAELLARLDNRPTQG